MNRVTVIATYDGREYVASKTYDKAVEYDTVESIVDQHRYMKATIVGTGAVCLMVDRETDIGISGMKVTQVKRDFDIDPSPTVSDHAWLYRDTDDFEY
jgi:hypothetical protein